MWRLVHSEVQMLERLEQAGAAAAVLGSLFAEQIEFEKKRTSLLSQINDENKRRFLQGRLDFQDYLRVREQWFDTQNRLLDKQAAYWKNLTLFSLKEDFPVPFCKETL